MARSSRRSRPCCEKCKKAVKVFADFSSRRLRYQENLLFLQLDVWTIKPRFSDFLLLYNCDDQPTAAARHQGSYLYRLGWAAVFFQSLPAATVHRINAARRRLR